MSEPKADSPRTVTVRVKTLTKLGLYLLGWGLFIPGIMLLPDGVPGEALILIIVGVMIQGGVLARE